MKMIDEFIERANSGHDLNITYVSVDHIDYEDRSKLMEQGFVEETDPQYLMFRDSSEKLSTKKLRRFKLTDAGIELIVLNVM